MGRWGPGDGRLRTMNALSPGWTWRRGAQLWSEGEVKVCKECARARMFSPQKRGGARASAPREPSERQPFNGSFSRTFQVEATANKWLKVLARCVSLPSPGPPLRAHRQVPRVGTRQSCSPLGSKRRGLLQIHSR